MRFRYYQDEAIDSIFDFFDHNGGKDENGIPVQANPIVAMPTGTGKSIVIGGFSARALQRWPRTRILALTHVKELIVQNSNKLLEIWPNAPMGIYSAGLNEKQTAHPIIFGGVASVAHNIDAFGFRDLVLIDECHLVSPKAATMYGKVLDGLRKRNPFLKVVGTTATKFRMGQGDLTDEGIFTHTCYDITGVDQFNRLIAEGYLSQLIPRPTQTKIDISGVGVSGGEFNLGQLQQAVDKQEITWSACQEMAYYGQDRKSWLVFCAGVEHAEHAAEMLNYLGIPTAAIHSNLDDDERDRRIAAFKRGELRCLTNNNVLTTGFDFPPIDLIAVLRHTMSPGLWVQMLGRGTRPYDPSRPGDVDPYIFPFLKRNCLVLDFANNTMRLGPINDPVIPTKRGKPTGEVPVKTCQVCGTYNHISARWCVGCGSEFFFQVKIQQQASDMALIKGDETPVVETFEVDGAWYSCKVSKKDKDAGVDRKYLAVTYRCGTHMFKETVLFEHGGLAYKKAVDWWRQRSADDCPPTSEKACEEALAWKLRVPARIRVWTNKKPEGKSKIYPEIIGYEF